MNTAAQSGDILGTSAFWLGALIFLLSQWGKFSEFNTEIRIGTTDPNTSPLKVTPRDLTSPSFYSLSLMAFLFASFCIYLILCLIPPSVLVGWLTISKNAEATKVLSDNPVGFYPLLVTAALIGLTQPVQGLDRLANLQKDIFHHWIGLPQRVVGTAISIAAQLSAGKSREALDPIFERLVSDTFISEIDDFADIEFYNHQLQRSAYAEDEQKQSVLKGSAREKAIVIRELVLFAAIATVRQSGGAGLLSLAGRLGVELPDENQRQPSFIGPAIFISGFVGLLLWAILSLEPVGDAARALFDLPGSIVWPRTPYAAAQYILANFVPLIVASLVVIASQARERPRHTTGRRLHMVIGDNFIMLFALFIGILFYDYVQAIVDRSVYKGVTYGGTGSIEFLGQRLLPYCCHALVATAFAVTLLAYLDREKADTDEDQMIWIVRLLLVVGVLSVINGYNRLQFFYKRIPTVGYDFVVLTVVLTLLASIVGFLLIVMSAQYRKHVIGTKLWQPSTL